MGKLARKKVLILKNIVRFHFFIASIQIGRNAYKRGLTLLLAYPSIYTPYYIENILTFGFAWYQELCYYEQEAMVLFQQHTPACIA